MLHLVGPWAKTTIYRRWPDRELLVVDAFMSATPPDLTIAETGCTDADIRAHMIGLATALAGDHGKAVREVIACGILEPTITFIHFGAYAPAGRAPVAKAPRRGVLDWTFGPGLSEEAVADALFAGCLVTT